MTIEDFKNWLQNVMDFYSSHFPVNEERKKFEFSHWCNIYTGYQKTALALTKTDLRDEVLKYKSNVKDLINGIDFTNWNMTEEELNENLFVYSVAYKFWERMEEEIDKKNDRTKVEPITDPSAKLMWLGKPAHLALIIDILIDKGYIDATPYGEQTAAILLNLFNFRNHKPSIESLGKLLHKDKYPIKNKTVIDQFNKIPKRVELK